ncbi:hypothetical protein B0H11DRAFT_1925821 [Mycena galericulata]|nr:hypothetical protein B0H11DRAFT_1925821 [Mycena galericulata]
MRTESMAGSAAAALVCVECALRRRAVRRCGTREGGRCVSSACVACTVLVNTYVGGEAPVGRGSGVDRAQPRRVAYEGRQHEQRSSNCKEQGNTHLEHLLGREAPLLDVVCRCVGHWDMRVTKGSSKNLDARTCVTSSETLLAWAADAELEERFDGEPTDFELAARSLSTGR